ncbi:hypothetical protein [Enterococcus faecium]|uniref:hypothetical protein n=1 Tax=Enterococcus faecium TaxID=1352 RepID=UPI00295EC5C2|nr:hypothetical protein [Enterococcus faecium]WOV56327.1 hypothetical protein R5U36_13320 [Enterococcus faecium]
MNSKIEKSKAINREIAEKNLHYSRFLLIRYLLPAFFFINTYWVFGLILCESYQVAIVVGIALLILCIGAITEQVKLYGNKETVVKKQLRFNGLFHWLQLTTNVFLLLVVLTGFKFKDYFPFFSQNTQVKVILLTTIAIGLIFSVISLRQIYLILIKKDKTYHYLRHWCQNNLSSTSIKR